ncbi:probable LRR receptor-like serine/threonine-protein kinase At3g47570 [Solanum dulcamara]|uniref:probable LRR receptor-like serine/threonine-protein kinase At3g47570 n=1 Tax=Solanum dulcamara TaxID=45834 RepID=UPI0024853DC9|nr:probable LRR receptor-like serine/threonine-protein kinase At3g47570 [Solanum dulcamara]
MNADVTEGARSQTREGVTCGSCHQRVKSLNLSNMTLTGRIPRDFGNLTFLVSLDLGSNNLHGRIPRDFGSITFLVSLDLRSNNFHGNLPQEMARLRRLKFIDLSSTTLEDIMQRLSIMIDEVCALEYLHHGCLLPVIYCDQKPSNILLDADMVAHLSDFGISKLLVEDEHHLYTKTLETLGYIAPEYALDGLVSIKCDVYSYGIMLLETFTRRKPNEFEGDLRLKQWVSYSLPEAVMDVVDANLVTPTDKRLQKKLDVVASIMKVALDCCAESPARRTNMKDVVGCYRKPIFNLLNVEHQSMFSESLVSNHLYVANIC